MISKSSLRTDTIKPGPASVSLSPAGVVVLAKWRKERWKLEERDEKELRWYFSQGEAMASRSTFGAMITALERGAYASTVCSRCDGVGVQNSGHWCPACKGTGSLPRSRERKEPNRSGLARCSPCRGRGGDCEECEGNGYRDTNPAFVTSEIHEPGGYVPKDGELRRRARISRIYERLTALHRHALALYYGDAGARWAATRRGQMFALYALTPSGQRLAKFAKRGTTKCQEDLCHLADEDQMATLKADVERRLLLNAAHQEARKLYTAAATDWNSAKDAR